MNNPIIMHINYCEQGQSFDEACRKAVNWGFDGVEFRSAVKGMETDAYLDTLAKAVEAAGLKIVIFGSPGPNLMTEDAAVRKKETAASVKFFRMAAKRFDLSVCNTFTGVLTDPDTPYSEYDKQGSALATEEHWAWATDGFQVLGNLAEELGFQLAFETHMCYLHDLPAPAKALVDRINKPSVGVNLDYGNAVYMAKNLPLDETIAAMKGRIYYTHLKNSIALPSGGRLATARGDGEINHRDYIKLLLAAGYEGPIGIEAPRSGDREWYAQQDLTYIKSVMRECS